MYLSSQVTTFVGKIQRIGRRLELSGGATSTVGSSRRPKPSLRTRNGAKIGTRTINPNSYDEVSYYEYEIVEIEPDRMVVVDDKGRADGLNKRDPVSW